MSHESPVRDSWLVVVACSWLPPHQRHCCTIRVENKVPLLLILLCCSAAVVYCSCAFCSMVVLFCCYSGSLCSHYWLITLLRNLGYWIQELLSMKNQQDSIDYCKQIAEGTTMHTAEGTSCHVTHEGTFSSHFYASVI